MADEPLPTVGRIVLFCNPGGRNVVPAIVTAAPSPTARDRSGWSVDLFTFTPNGGYETCVPQNGPPGIPSPGCWAWPARAPGPLDAFRAEAEKARKERPPAPVVGGDPIPMARVCTNCEVSDWRPWPANPAKVICGRCGRLVDRV